MKIFIFQGGLLSVTQQKILFYSVFAKTLRLDSRWLALLTISFSKAELIFRSYLFGFPISNDYPKGDFKKQFRLEHHLEFKAMGVEM